MGSGISREVITPQRRLISYKEWKDEVLLSVTKDDTSMLTGALTGG